MCNITSDTSSSLFPLQLFLQWVSSWKCSLSHGPQRFQSGDECVFEPKSPHESKCFSSCESHTKIVTSLSLFSEVHGRCGASVLDVDASSYNNFLIFH